VFVPELPSAFTILVVDDDETVRTVTARMLMYEGFAVLTAGDGLEALQLLDECPDPVSLIVSDLKMPRMTGRELAERLSERTPAIPMLFVSGHPTQVLAGALPGPVLMKPFAVHDLVSTVYALLSTHRHQLV
jgi:two-component system, cell cycle sensor histidine kinase and response regulator CckA